MLKIEIGNTYCSRMKSRGGGVTKINVDLPIDVKGAYFLIVNIFVNVCDSMGANLVNTVCEKLAPELEKLTEGRAGLKILTNLCTERKAWSRFRVNFSKMGYKGLKGEEVASKILEAYDFALTDNYRAATHNKGIMNGIDAVCLATGQD